MTELEIKLRIADLAMMLYAQKDNTYAGGAPAWAWADEQAFLINKLLEGKNKHEQQAA